MADKKDAGAEKAPTMEDRMSALESAVHGLQIKHGQQGKQLDALNEVNALRLKSRGFDA